MSVTYDDDEASVEDGSARELYTITQSLNVVYHQCSGEQDIDFGGQTYTAVPMSRSEIGAPTLTGETSLTLTLPLNHPLVLRWMLLGIPPMRTSINVLRLQLRSGEARQIWDGEAVTMSIEGLTAKFAVPSRFQRTTQRRLPLFSIDRNCQHILYDSNCKVGRGAFMVTTNVVSMNGRDLTLRTVDAFGDADFALGGELIHVATGERQTILFEGAIAFDGTTAFTIQLGIPDMQVGDFVQVYAGCIKTPSVCTAKYANMVNFGGFPDLPTANPFLMNSHIFGQDS